MKITAKVVKDNFVYFQYYRDGELWYKLQFENDAGQLANFIFPVPIADCGSAIFTNTDKAIYFMRWMKKYAEKLEADGVDGVTLWSHQTQDI